MDGDKDRLLFGVLSRPGCVRPTAGSLEVARLFPFHRGPVLDRASCGRVDFFRGQKHHCAYARAARLADGEGERGGTLVVRKLGDGEGVRSPKAK